MSFRVPSSPLLQLGDEAGLKETWLNYEGIPTQLLTYTFYTHTQTCKLNCTYMASSTTSDSDAVIVMAPLPLYTY